MHESPKSPIRAWQEEISALARSGGIICPLMTREPARFLPTICLCDIPATRKRVLEHRASCTRGDDCLGRICFPDEACDELYRNVGGKR